MKPLPFLALIGVLLPGAAGLSAEPLSRKINLDFYGDVGSRDLQGMAIRSDGRLLAGPSLTDLAGTAPAELLWCLDASPDGRWLIGTGPDGKIFEVTVDAARGAFAAKEFARLDDSQVFAVKSLGDGAVLAGTSPKGSLYLLRKGRPAARVDLPADSIFSILPLSAGVALVATGNPGRIYRVDLAKLAAAAPSAATSTGAAALAARGVTLFGEVRDRNVRILAQLADGRIAAGSAPLGNVYVFPAPAPGLPAREDPILLQENRDAEVTGLLAQQDGGLLATIVFSGGVADVRPDPTRAKAKDGTELPPPARLEKFSGHSSLVQFPADGFPQTLAGRPETAFYGLALQSQLVIISGGETGDIAGYDFEAQRTLTFAGSASARLNSIVPMPGRPGRFLILRNNSPGLALLDFHARTAREAQTQVVDLGVPARLGALRIDRLRDIAPAELAIDIKAGNGSDDLEGWCPWSPLASAGDGWRGAALRGRYVRLRLRLPAATAPTVEIDRAELYFLPQNRPPQLRDFHLLPPNSALVAPSEPPAAPIPTLGQLLQGKDDEKRKAGLLSSTVVPSPGMQVACWTVSDPDGDTIVCTFSIRRDGDGAWTDLAVDTRDSYVQFDTAHLPDGVYFTRLTAREAAPRPEGDRLRAVFETDNLVVDHTPPAILEASARLSGGRLIITVRGRDALSLLDRVEVALNNGVRETLDQPADGIRDGREETFVLEEPLDRAAGATAAEVTLYDSAGNGATRRLELPR